MIRIRCAQSGLARVRHHSHPLRHPQGTATLRLAELPSLGALQARIAELTGIAAAEQEREWRN
jgi:hypothetical protein